MFKIITDSSANLTDELIDKYDLHILSLEFNIDGEVYLSYVKGAKSDLTRFYTMMRQGRVVKTSLPSPKDVETMAHDVFADGSDVLYLGFDSALSGTFKTVSAHLESVRKESYPTSTLLCVDTLAAAFGQGLFVLEACRMRDAGKSIEEVAKWAEEQRLRFAHWFTVDDLHFLERGGRLSKGVAIAGSLLNIKPVLHIDDEGRLVPVAKVRGRKKSLLTLIEHFANDAADPKDGQLVTISHGDCLEDALYVADELKKRFGIEDPLINTLDPVIGAHSGPGTLALFFQTDGKR
ncbi:MAG: DegV family protein [Coriobacteriales bacterium]|jgi:DegV family protein with EDD domain|nr:DegV family protein [Coriobacteriales bacterium]